MGMAECGKLALCFLSRLEVGNPQEKDIESFIFEQRKRDKSTISILHFEN
jgi:hypothetical protein